MTPGINLVKKSKIFHKVHEYTHDASSESSGLEAAEKLGIPETSLFKTLVVSLDNKELAVGVVPLSSMLSMKLIAKAAGAVKEGCHQLHLDSGIQREGAHRFYEREGMSKGAFHFVEQVSPDNAGLNKSQLI